jgi:hypothetical protein
MITKTKTKNSDLAELFGLDKLIKSSDVMKQKLIAMAKSGAKKPHYKKTKEGIGLGNYTGKLSLVYDPVFDKTIKKLRPDWFVSTAKTMRKRLIAIAKSGAKKPQDKTKEGRALRHYTSKSSGSYCPEFDKTIKKLRPDWFVSAAKTMRKRLIAIAKSGAKKPNSKKTKEGRLLSNYTKKYSGSYCPEFDELIRKLRPDWFI